MRKNVKRLLGLLVVVALVSASVLLACKKTYVEEYYSGRVVGVEMCNTRTNGYLIELDSPKGVGDTMTLGSKFYKNLVIGYEAPTRLKDVPNNGICQYQLYVCQHQKFARGDNTYGRRRIAIYRTHFIC